MKSATAHERIWTVIDLIRWGTEYFAEKGLESSRLTMELLLCHVLDSSRIKLYSEFDRPLLPSELAALRSLVQRIAHHEPIQYVTGIADFYSLRFHVTPDVLIPRQETEILVDEVIKRQQVRGAEQSGLLFADQDEPRVEQCLDIGTGSGCIAIAAAVHLPNTRWVCVDRSVRALEVARTNAQKHAVESRCEFVQTNILTEIPDGQFDVITMNPPYIPSADVAGLEERVRDYEPHLALTDDADGLSFYRRMASLATTVLKPTGTLFMELGWGQEQAVRDIFCEGWKCVVVHDLADIPRVLVVTRV